MTIPTASPLLRDRFHDLNASSSQEAEALAAQGKRATLWKLIGSPFLEFLRTYWRKGAWRHGVAGLIDAMFASYKIFVCHAKLWELHHTTLQAPPPPRT
jgi:hypothetical protein